MDNYDASHKRFRASYPSLDNPGFSPHDGFSFRGLPTPESQGYPSPSPAIATASPTQSNARKDSTLANTTPSKGKRKAVEVVDLTGESDATAPLPKPSGGGDVIDLTEDCGTSARLPNPSFMNSDSERRLWYRSQKARPQHHSYALQCPHQHQFPTVQDPSVPRGPEHEGIYSNSRIGSNSRLHPDTQRHWDSNSHQHAYTQQSQFPKPYSYPNVSGSQALGATGNPWTPGIQNGNDGRGLKAGAHSNSEHSAPTHGLVNRGLHDSIDPHQIVNRLNDSNAAYARQVQDRIDKYIYGGTVASPNAIDGAREQTQCEPSKPDPHAARALLQTWADNARKIPCSGCNKAMIANEVNLSLLSKKWLENPTMDISSVISCDVRPCSARTCLGCGRRCHTTGFEVSAQTTDGSKLYWCCDSGRMVLLWIVLCGCDRRKTVRRNRAAYFRKANKGSNISGAGVGYGSHPAYGSEAAQMVNFGKYGQLNNSRVSLAQPVDALPTAERGEDDFTTRAMACLDVLLPSLMAVKASNFDLEPPPLLLAILSQSSILGAIAALLRNDSLEDATKKTRLYTNTLNVVDRLSSHHATADSTINLARQESSSPSDILKLSYSAPNELDDDKYEENDSLASCLHNLHTASKSILLRAKAHPQDFVGGDSEQMLSLCERVSQTADSILANAKSSPSFCEQTATAQTNDDWQSEMAVLELPDETIMPRHTYAAEATSASNLATGRMKALSLQLSNLTSSIPPGIFVRHCASRIDVMKILIIGPKDTPYENGLFEFDLFCPAQFPNVPPKMKFRTTGGGTVRFNPNLYNDGKVCLSLLGTWTGPTWQPGKSTILQILVSIQAMVFCDEPWYNEPGRNSNPTASRAHNRELQGHTVRHAMLGWLRGPGDSVWGEVVREHFGECKGVVEATVGVWGLEERARGELGTALKGIGVGNGTTARV